MRAKTKRNKKQESAINSLEDFFKSAKIPDAPIQLGPGEKIIDVKKFVTSHLKTARTYQDVPICIPYLNRLEKLKSIIHES